MAFLARAARSLRASRTAPMAFSTPELIDTEAWATDQLRFIQEERFPQARDAERCAACDYTHLCRA